MDARTVIIVLLLCFISPKLFAESGLDKDGFYKEIMVDMLESEPAYRVVKEVDFLDVKLELIGNLKSINAKSLEKKLDVEYAKRIDFFLPRAPKEQEKLDFKKVGILTCKLFSLSAEGSYLKPYYLTCYIEAEISDELADGVYCRKIARSLESFSMSIVSDDYASNEINKSIEQLIEIISLEAFSIRSGNEKDKFAKEIEAKIRSQR